MFMHIIITAIITQAQSELHERQPSEDTHMHVG